MGIGNAKIVEHYRQQAELFRHLADLERVRQIKERLLSAAFYSDEIAARVERRTSSSAARD
jgi:hypothetical protein